MKQLNRSSFLCFLLFIVFFAGYGSAYAFDASKDMTIVAKKAHWYVIEYASPTQIIYRIASDSISQSNMHIAFDFATSKKCVPSPATLIVGFGSYKESLNNGMLPMEYKLPGQKQAAELVDTVMQENDTYAFMSFKGLTTNKLLMSKDKGKLVVWVSPSGDGSVQRSNTYFSLDGFSSAYKEAKKICNENR